MPVVEALQQKNASACVFRSATADDALELVASYESVFGRGGVRAAGHEPYPAPEVFSCDGVLSIVNDPRRDFIVAVVDGAIAGAMIVTHNSQFHREFGCVSVGKEFQGRGISSLMLGHAKDSERRCSLAINTTEIVTHSMLSQSAHNKAGYRNVTGLGFCQYPRVFFAAHPESCLWITSLEGHVFDWLRYSRPHRERAEQDLSILTEEEQSLLTVLQSQRHIYVPGVYFDVASKIISQFDDTLSYRISSSSVAHSSFAATTSSLELKLELWDDAPYAYLTFPHAVAADLPQAFKKAWALISASGKRYVQARIPANTAAALTHIEFLRQRGFIFLGIAPLFGWNTAAAWAFEDVFLMQWLAPSVLAVNSLPGETDSVIKLYGYPLNLTRDIVATMQKDLSERVTGS